MNRDELEALAVVDGDTVRMAGRADNPRFAELVLTDTPEQYAPQSVEFFIGRLAG